MAIEIVDFPINSMVIFHSYVSSPEGNHLKIPVVSCCIIPSSMNFVGLIYLQVGSWNPQIIPDRDFVVKITTALLTTGMILQAVNEAIIY